MTRWIDFFVSSQLYPVERCNPNKGKLMVYGIRSSVLLLLLKSSIQDSPVAYGTQSTRWISQPAAIEKLEMHSFGEGSILRGGAMKMHPTVNLQISLGKIRHQKKRICQDILWHSMTFPVLQPRDATWGVSSWTTGRPWGGGENPIGWSEFPCRVCLPMSA